MEAVQGSLTVGFGEEQAVRLGLTSADPAAQLIELGQTEPLGGLNHHDGRIRHIHSDFNHGS